MNEVNIIIGDESAITGHLPEMINSIKAAGFKPKILLGSKIAIELLNDSSKLEMLKGLL